MPTIKQILEQEDEEQLLQDAQRQIREFQNFIDELRRQGKGIEWNGEVQGWVIVDTPGINSRKNATEKMEPKRKLPTISDALADGKATIWSALPFQAYPQAASNAASGATRWKERQMSENRFSVSYDFRKGSGSTLISMLSPADEMNAQNARASIWNLLRGMRDLDADVYLAFLAQLVKTRHDRDKDGWTWITAPQILEYRGVQPRIEKTEHGKKYRAGHRHEDIAPIEVCVYRMWSTRVTVDQAIFEEPVHGRGKRKATRSVRYTRESPLFQFGERLTKQELWPHQEGIIAPQTEIAWQIKESAWMEPFIAGTNELTGELLQSCLHYDYYHETWEKRLSQYLMFHLTMNRHGNSITRQIGTIIEELSLDQEMDERYPSRVKDRFEKALDRLKCDGHIGRWRYKEEVELPARKWLPTWLANCVVFTRPVSVDALPGQ